MSEKIYATPPARYYVVGNESVWSADQMNDYADETHALRTQAHAAQAPVTDLQNVHDAVTVDLLNERVAYLEAKLKEAQAPQHGYVLVPTEPTDEMLKAADDGDDEYTLRSFGPGVQRVMQGPYDHYCAMIAAATKAPQQAAPAVAEKFLESPDVQDESGLNTYYSRELVLGCIEAALSRAAPQPEAQAPAVPAESVKRCACGYPMPCAKTVPVGFCRQAITNQGAAPQPEAQAPAVPAVGNSGFDHRTAASILDGKAVSDEYIRKFVQASRWAHDDRASLQATLQSVRNELVSREAEIALLKTALMEAEAAPQQEPVTLYPGCSHWGFKDDTVQPAPSGDAQGDIEAAAKTLAQCMDYPWEHMPEKGRAEMRKHAQAVIDAARKEGNKP